jgi:phosphate transport system substrate-binding protein
MCIFTFKLIFTQMKLICILCVTCLFLFSCGVSEDYTKKDSPTSGKAIFYFDEGLFPHIKNQIFTFQTIYPNADIVLKPSNEKEAIQSLYDDCTKVIAISRPLTEKEIAQFKTKNIVPQFSFVAGNAVAFIVNKEFTDSTLSILKLKQLLLGNDSSYQPNQHINIIFNNVNSGVTRHLKDSVLPNDNFGKNCSAVNNTNELIDKIANNKFAIGVCDYAWFSDKDDSTVKNLLTKIKILAISKENSTVAYMPDQSNIATRDYPFCRTICIIRRSSDFSLGKGIETFIAGEKGQLMFLKQGLPPHRQEERVIEIDMTPMKIN